MNNYNIYKEIELNSLSATGAYKIISTFILENIDFLDKLSIKKIRTEWDVSDATIVRYFKDLGFHGFFEFRKAMQEIEKNHSFNNHEIIINRHNFKDNKLFYNKYLSLLSDGQESINQLLDAEKLYEAAVMLYQAQTIYMAAFNINYHQSLDFKNKLICYGKKIFLDNDLHSITSFANIASVKDLFITITFSGTNSHVLNLGQIAKKNGSKWLHITQKNIWKYQSKYLPDLILEINCKEQELWNLYTIRGELLFELETLIFIELLKCDPKAKIFKNNSL